MTTTTTRRRPPVTRARPRRCATFPAATTLAAATTLVLSASAALVLAVAAGGATGARESVTPAPSSPPTGGERAAIAASFHPDRLGARGALAIAIELPRGAASNPEPLRRAVLRLPAGLGVQVPQLRSCAPQRLRALGARGCSAQALLGTGSALVQAPLGASFLSERVSLWVFLGPLRNLQPTFEVLAQGYTPFDERVVLSGSVLPDESPYGEDLALSVPAIPTLPLEPEASIVSMALQIGASRSSAREPNATVEPSRCPRGGFPFAAQFSYAGGSTEDATTTVPCPR